MEEREEFPFFRERHSQPTNDNLTHPNVSMMRKTISNKSNFTLFDILLDRIHEVLF